ncbi:uncharacterized protein DEA37_0003675 [Paragonimus westermani]|uniref:Uncharacterized protein n=1 Tax=Paragonimus westermani TaxID=34504 RepID=A0A5J4P175_9TREM|nr:uncharacterized protein DEA37_0003675 [Paragonimus westermani]
MSGGASLDSTNVHMNFPLLLQDYCVMVIGSLFLFHYDLMHQVIYTPVT